MLIKYLKKKTKIILRIKNISLNKNEYIEINDSFKNNYFDLIKGAVKMPILSPGSVSIGNNKYKDSPSLEKGFLDEINNYKDITDVLIIYNKPQQKVAIKLPDKNYLEIIPEFVTSSLETKPDILEKGFLSMKNLVIDNFQK